MHGSGLFVSANSRERQSQFIQHGQDIVQHVAVWLCQLEQTSASFEHTNKATFTVQISLKLPYMSPIVSGSAPLQTAITTAEVLR